MSWARRQRLAVATGGEEVEMSAGKPAGSRGRRASCVVRDGTVRCHAGMRRYEGSTDITQRTHSVAWQTAHPCPPCPSLSVWDHTLPCEPQRTRHRGTRRGKHSVDEVPRSACRCAPAILEDYSQIINRFQSFGQPDSTNVCQHGGWRGWVRKDARVLGRGISSKCRRHRESTTIQAFGGRSSPKEGVAHSGRQWRPAKIRAAIPRHRRRRRGPRPAEWRRPVRPRGRV